MRKTMRWISISLVVAIMGALFLSSPPTVLAQRFRGGVVYVEPVPVYGPFFPYAYPYPYGYYAARNYGYVKVNTHGQNADVYVDGGYAAKTTKPRSLRYDPAPMISSCAILVAAHSSRNALR